MNCRGKPSATFQTRSVLSSAALATSRPSGLTARCRTSALWPKKLSSSPRCSNPSRPTSAGKTCTLPFWSPSTRCLASGVATVTVSPDGVQIDRVALVSAVSLTAGIVGARQNRAAVAAPPVTTICSSALKASRLSRSTAAPDPIGGPSTRPLAVSKTWNPRSGPPASTRAPEGENASCQRPIANSSSRGLFGESIRQTEIPSLPSTAPRTSPPAARSIALGCAAISICTSSSPLRKSHTRTALS